MPDAAHLRVRSGEYRTTPQGNPCSVSGDPYDQAVTGVSGVTRRAARTPA